MPAVNDDTRYRAIEQMLAQRAGEAPDARAFAEAALGIWQQVAARLAPVIGSRGVHILFKRALHLAGKDFPWLIVAGNDNGSIELAGLLVCFEARPVDSARAASYALLTTFIDLLASMIGKSLTSRLLDPIWTPAPSASEQENAP